MSVDLQKWLVHEPPMILLDRFVKKIDNGVVCEVTVRPGIPFFQHGCVPAYVGIEYMAQTIAVYTGMRRNDRGAAKELGYLLGSRRIEVHTPYFSNGETLTVSGQQVWDSGSMGQFDCAIRTDEKLLMRGTLNVYVPAQDEK